MSRSGLSWRVAILAIVLAITPMASAFDQLTPLWISIQSSLESGDLTQLTVQAEEMRDFADAHGGVRLTPHARALLDWARSKPGVDREQILSAVDILDPELVAAAFARSRWAWEDGSKLKAIGSYFSGWRRLLADGMARRLVASSVALWLLLAVWLTTGSIVLILVARQFRTTVADCLALGRAWMHGLNGLVLGLVLLLLPCLIGFGPIWLVCWLFAIGFVALSERERILGGILWGMLILVGFGLSIVPFFGLREQAVLDRVERALEENRADPVVVAEITSMATQIGTNGLYHVVRGELLRRHGDIEAARLAFEKAREIDEDESLAYLLLGNLSLEENDSRSAQVLLKKATELDPSLAPAFFNLGTALDDQTHFNEGDHMRDEANRVATSDQLDLMRVLPAGQPLYPEIGKLQVDPLRRAIRSQAASPSPPIAEWAQRPSTLVFLVCSLLCIPITFLRIKFWMPSSACTRCGQPFFPHQTESTVYCGQCVSVFLKKDQVSIEVRSLKMTQIRRWESRSTWMRRIFAILLPGSGLVLKDLAWVGFLLLGVIVFCLVGALVWLPGFIAAIEPWIAVQPLGVLMLAVAISMWLASIRASWGR